MFGQKESQLNSEVVTTLAVGEMLEMGRMLFWKKSRGREAV